MSKSFVTGVGFKPITRMNKPEVDALRSARSIRSQGGRGHLGKYKFVTRKLEGIERKRSV